MRSLATDIRNGLEKSRYKTTGLLLDGKGGHCVMGAAFLGVGTKKGRDFKASRYGELWREQLEAGIIAQAVTQNNSTTRSREEIADNVEIMEWERLGIPTRKMKAQLATVGKVALEVAVMLLLVVIL